MVYCCVPDCKSHQERDKLISFHEFPSDEELRKIWLKNIPRKDFIPNDTSASSVVCSKHFKEDDYVPSLKNRRLKRGSVPTVFQDNLKFKTPALEKNIQIRKLLPKIDMAAVDEVQLLSKIQDTYVPFLKKLIAFLEKNKKATPENLTKLKAIYTIFTTAPSSEQVETFYANQKKLENWYNKAQKEKHAEDGETKGTKRGLVLSDTESSQGAPDSGPPVAKRSNFANSFSDSSQPAITLVQSVNTNSTTTPIPISQIKKEKVDLPKVVQKTAPPVVATPPPAVIAPPPPAAPDPVPPADGPISFTCASCQFQTKDETEFMKHARTDHRTDLSMWCKQCGKCFSNAGVLVSHIKERACTKEEMIYKCGVKDCIFETTSGQTFVHHLRHCHKGSPFIYCVHCQKIFTLPHCLILHMQDDCPFKDKNRRNPGAMPAANDKPADPKPSTVSVTPQQPVISQVQQVIRSPAPITYSPRPAAPTIRPVSSVRPSLPPLGTPLRARGRNFRGRGRGRGRGRISDDSSDSDDPDDPSWRPEELLGETGLRRSGRWAKKINDVRNPEPSTSGVTTSAKKTFSSAELNTKMINCPCCDFMAAFQSVLEDHYIANHKLANKNACLVCNLKFENTRSFLDHFEEHRKGALPNKPPSEIIEASKPVEKSKQVEPPAKALSAPAKPLSAPQPLNAPAKPLSIPANAQSVPAKTTGENEPYDDVLMSIADAKLADPKSNKDTVKIPYQAAILDKNLKDSKLKKFEELKSPNDLIAMKNIDKLKNFFKCGMYNCTFTTDITVEFSSHLLVKHEGKRYFCCYCLKEYLNCDSMANHMVINHNKRTFQCSKCLYRGYSKHHVQIHIKNFHEKDTDTEILTCEQVENPNKTADDDLVPEIIDTTWPYICAIGDCSFNSYDPKEFKRHNETIHRTVSVFFCHYCKVDFLTFKRLMNHYRLHGLNTFQCNYCIHGADTKEEILLHLCNAHADSPLKAYMRGSQEEASSEVKQLNTVISEDSNDTGNVGSPRPELNSQSAQNKQGKLTGCEKELYHVIDNKYYPEELQLACFPRYTRNITSDVICGIPSCEGKFESISLYLSHLRNIHDALNFPCPHCPDIFDAWEHFKSHLLCHGSKLYTCGTKDCEFYHFSKEKVKEHTKEHTDSESNVLAVREYTTEIAEEQVVSSLELTCEIPHVEKVFMCLFCHYKSSDRSIMKNHLYKELAYTRFSCRLCDKKYLSRKDVKNHFINAHPGLDIICSTDINPEVEAVVKTILKIQDKFKAVGTLADLCVTCCRKIKNPLRLQSHMHICLQREYHPYECSRCKKSHVNILALRYHTEQEHHPDPIDVSETKNYAIEDDVGKNILRIRLQQLKEIFKNLNVEIVNDDGKSKLKFYTCSVCPFEADHKFSVQKHIKEQHENTNGVVIKAMHRLNSCDNLSQSDENSNDGPSNIKRYSCGFCIRKMYTIQEMENHMKNIHPSKNAEEYFYYFTPDAGTQFPPEDKDTYECAYCKSSRENLFSLKKHSDLMHSEMEFKVKGFVSRVQSQNYLACGHCYSRLKNMTEFHQHSSVFHPLLLPKYIGDAQTNKPKRSIDSVDDIPNKRVKLGSTVYECTHCGGAFSTNEQVILHSNRAHRSLQIEFRIIDQTSNNAESADMKFYKCEFCRFTSERQYLDKHLATKHKMRVTCSYCHKRFEFASKLKEHHDVAHKDLPLKYSQETVGAAVDDISNNDIPKSDDAIPEPFSYYGTRPEPLDLSSLTVHMDTKEGESAKLSLVYVTELFNMFPKVIVKDIKKMENKVEIE